MKIRGQDELYEKQVQRRIDEEVGRYWFHAAVATMKCAGVELELMLLSVISKGRSPDNVRDLVFVFATAAVGAYAVAWLYDMRQDLKEKIKKIRAIDA